MGVGVMGRTLEAIFAFLFWMYSFAYHRIPNNFRSTKYIAFYYGAFFWQWVFVNSIPSFSSVALLHMSTIVVYFSVRRLLRPMESLQRSETSTMRTLTWYRRMMYVGPNVGMKLFLFHLLKAIPLLGDLF